MGESYEILLFVRKEGFRYFSPLQRNCSVRNKSSVNLAIDYSQNSSEHISSLSREKNVHTRELPTHVSQFVLFSRAVVSELISFTSSCENPFAFHKVTASTAKWCKTWEIDFVMEHEKPLHALHVSCIFMLWTGFAAFLWPVCKASCKLITKCDKCVEDFLQFFAWFVKHVVCVSYFTPFHKKGQFLYETSKEFCEILSRQKENHAKYKKCIEVISSSFHIRIIFCEMTAKVLQNAKCNKHVAGLTGLSSKIQIPDVFKNFLKDLLNASNFSNFDNFISQKCNEMIASKIF